VPEAEPASILDASALIAFLHDEPGSDRVLDAIAQTAAVSVVNWAEALSKVASDGDDPQQVAAAFDGTLVLEPLTEMPEKLQQHKRPPGTRPELSEERHAELVRRLRDDVARLVGLCPELDLSLWPNFADVAPVAS